MKGERWQYITQEYRQKSGRLRRHTKKVYDACVCGEKKRIGTSMCLRCKRGGYARLCVWLVGKMEGRMDSLRHVLGDDVVDEFMKEKAKIQEMELGE